jgi:rSAM/selenodomain-associated transferase 1
MNEASPGKFHIAIFARTPVPGSVKTRLIPVLGAEGAARAQRQMLLRTLRTAQQAAAGNVSLWIAGDLTHPFLQDCSRDFGATLHSQCDGDLGLRMGDCLRRLLASEDKVLLTGSDCPAFTAQILTDAAAALGPRTDLVFGPAEDGGYVLVGARRHADGAVPLALEAAFRDIPWSTGDVMAITRQRLTALGIEAGATWHEMPALWDIDEPADYLRAQGAGLLD